MPFSSYSMWRVLWPIWAWEAHLRDGSVGRGLAIGKNAARRAARACIRNAVKNAALGTEADSR
jgi:hypothetical protein